MPEPTPLTRHDLVGAYEASSDEISMSMQLRSDGTYSMRWAVSGAEMSAPQEGRWTLENNELSLEHRAPGIGIVQFNMHLDGATPADLVSGWNGWIDLMSYSYELDVKRV